MKEVQTQLKDLLESVGGIIGRLFSYSDLVNTKSIFIKENIHQLSMIIGKLYDCGIKAKINLSQIINPLTDANMSQLNIAYFNIFVKLF